MLIKNNFTSKQIDKRKNIYKKLSKTKIKNINKLFFYGKINNYLKLKNAVNLYLSENLTSFFEKEKKFKNINSLINDLFKLPNITPNGIVHPTAQTSIVFNHLVKTIFESINNILPFIETAAMPVVRVKKGKKNNPLRPYSTSKLHSDAWVGQYGDAIISFGIDGDFNRNGVDFFYTNKTSKDFFKKIKNYDLGLKKISKLKKIGTLKKGIWTLFDHAILHKTKTNKNAKPRISIDIAVKIKSKNYRKINSADKKRFKYFSIENFVKIGFDRFIGIKRKIIKNNIVTTHKFLNFTIK